jgi:hypothetical protein
MAHANPRLRSTTAASLEVVWKSELGLGNNKAVAGAWIFACTGRTYGVCDRAVGNPDIVAVAGDQPTPPYHRSGEHQAGRCNPVLAGIS